MLARNVTEFYSTWQPEVDAFLEQNGWNKVRAGASADVPVAGVGKGRQGAARVQVRVGYHFTPAMSRHPSPLAALEQAARNDSAELHLLVVQYGVQYGRLSCKGVLPRGSHGGPMHRIWCMMDVSAS